MYERKSRLSDWKRGRLIEHFVAGTTARAVAELVGVHRNTAASFYTRLRKVIAEEMEKASPFAGEIEETTNARWTEDRGTFEEVELAIQTVLKRIETPTSVVAPGSPRERGAPRLGRWFALGLLDKVEESNAVESSDGVQASRILRLASDKGRTLARSATDSRDRHNPRTRTRDGHRSGRLGLPE